MEIYLGNLPYNTTEADLRTFLVGCGELAALKLVVDQGTGTSRGYAFITLADQSRTQAVVDMLDGRDFGGRNIRVNLSHPKAIAYRGFGGASYSGRGPRDKPLGHNGIQPPGKD